MFKIDKRCYVCGLANAHADVRMHDGTPQCPAQVRAKLSARRFNKNQLRVMPRTEYAYPFRRGPDGTTELVNVDDPTSGTFASKHGPCKLEMFREVVHLTWMVRIISMHRICTDDPRLKSRRS